MQKDNAPTYLSGEGSSCCYPMRLLFPKRRMFPMRLRDKKGAYCSWFFLSGEGIQASLTPRGAFFS